MAAASRDLIQCAAVIADYADTTEFVPEPNKEGVEVPPN